MGPGHFAVGFAAKRWAPRTSLGTLFLAAELLDVVWPVLVLLGIEHVRIVPGITVASPLDFYDYPISHSLVAAIVWGGIFAVLLDVTTGRRRDAWVVGGLVVSHWVLDLVVHRPDLPLWPGGPNLGLGLWNHPALTATLEMLMLLVGLGLYLGATRPLDRVGRVGPWVIVALLVAIWVATLVGPPPPSPRALALSALGLWALILPAYWVDRHRRALAVRR